MLDSPWEMELIHRPEVALIHKMRWTETKIGRRLETIEPLVYRRSHPIPPFHYTKLAGPPDPPLTGVEVNDSGWPLIEPDSYWGEQLANFTLRTHFEVPTGWDRDAPAALYLPLGDAGDFSHPESLAYVDGAPYAAADRHHREIRLEERWRDGKSHLLALHGWCGRLSGPPGTRLLMRPCSVVQVDQATRDFLVTARVALETAHDLDGNEPVKGYLLDALDEAFKILDTREPFGDPFYASVPRAHAALKEGIAKAGPPPGLEIVCTGHAHIDVAWLWTLGQTRRKAGRTFHTVLRLMEQFPGYHFTQSQPQLYDFVRRDYPELFEGIKQRVAEGRWEPIGGMWVEADCNLTGSESLARQFLLGTTFFRKHFGEKAQTRVLWLPDVFGYAWNLPQLIKQAELDYFFTIKIGWSQYNRLPYDSFWWQGLDGTKVLTHFSTTPEPGSVYASSYNAPATPTAALGTWTNFQQKELQHELLMAYGYGDGGGGPTREMVENIQEMGGFPGLPRTRQGSVGEFFRNLEETSGARLPTWNGELYLELHRGTYTTQSRNKRANRKNEFLLHDAEFVAALASVLAPGYTYPSDTLRQAWELVCLNQFHDIIPGSSIGDVYVESQAQYRQVAELGQEVRATALEALGRQAGGDLLLVNPTGFARSDLAFWSGKLPVDRQLQIAGGSPVQAQATDQGTWLAAGELPAYSVTALAFAPTGGDWPDTGLQTREELLENAYLRVELNGDGDIVRIYDKVNAREVLPPGAFANQFQAFEDRPMNWDAWDVDIFYDDKMWTSDPATSMRVTEHGPLRATIEINRRILNSDYTQRISLAYNSPRLDVDTAIDWRERHILLKVAFPVDVLSPVATHEIQWGNVERPTHRNTSWDWARFETCAHKWVDLSEGGYGVSLLNDCKYGHDVRDNVLRISLLRSPTLPDPEADQGEHRFAYCLLPHVGGWNEVTVSQAYALNDPLLVAEGNRSSTSKGAASLRLLSADRPNVVIETVKQAEDGRGLIVRLYESQRRRGPVTLRTGFPLKGAWRANLLERDGEALPVEGNQVRFPIRPYEIVTLRLVPARG